MLQIHSLAASASGQLFSGNFWILLGIALSACVLGIQVACIVMLVRKLMQAKREKERIENEENGGFHSQYAAAVLGAAIPISAEGILAVAVGLNALAALVFVILVIAFRAKGYDYAASSDASENETKADGTSFAEEPAFDDEPPKAPARTVAYGRNDAADASMEEIWNDGAAPAEEPAVAAFASETVSAPAVVGGEVTSVETVVNGNGQNPVRIVKIEKEYSETIRETVPGAPSSDASNEQTERLIAKIDRLIDKIEGNREQQSAHVANGIILAADEPVPTDEDDDEDETDEDSADALSSENGDEDDVDMEADDNEHFTGNERIIGFDEDTGYYIVAHYRKSFEAKLIQSRPNIKHYYSELKNALLAYKGSKSRISWTADSFHNGRSAIAKINVKTKILELYLALDPASLEGTVYRGQDVSHLKKYADTPFRYKIRTPRKFKWAMELVQRVCEEHGLSPIDIENVDYEAAYPFEDTDSLVARGLIKEYIREEKPASTFELDETHVPSVSDLDETVIPANANISWEFDNDVLAQKEPEPEAPVAEEVAEPAEEPQEEPAPAAPAAPTQTVIRETTRTTQVRYTEQYFGESGETTTYKEYFSEDGPLKAEFFESNGEKKEESVSETAEQETVAEYAESFEDEAEVEADETEDSLENAEATEDSAAEAYGEDELEVDETDGGLDWSVPAGVSEQEAVVIDSYVEEELLETEDYVDDEVPFDEDARDYAETYEDEGQAYAEEGETYDYAEESYDGEEAQYEEETVEIAEEPVQAPKLNPDVALVDIGILEENFHQGAQIDLAALKAKGLVLPTAKILKIYKSGELTKSFTVVADHFTMDAIFAIDAAGGNIQMIKK